MKHSTSLSAPREPGERRYRDLRCALESRRTELDSSIRGQLSLVRDERAAADHVGALDDGEVADVDVQEEIELALVQMRFETIARIDAALARLEAGQYGRCAECGDDISDARLRALPFAVRCVECEEARENTVREGQFATTRQQRLFTDVLVPIT